MNKMWTTDRELEALKLGSRYPDIVQMYEAFDRRNVDSDSETPVHFIFELCSKGSLKKRLEDLKKETDEFIPKE